MSGNKKFNQELDVFFQEDRGLLQNLNSLILLFFLSLNHLVSSADKLDKTLNPGQAWQNIWIQTAWHSNGSP